MEPIIEKYSTPIPQLYTVLDACVQDAITRYTKEDSGIENPSIVKWQKILESIIDVRMWIQIWPNNFCGFPNKKDRFGVEIPFESVRTLAPTVVLKFSRHLRYVYHDGRFAYKVKGSVSVTYYDSARSRRLPGADDTGTQSYLYN